MGQIQDKYMWKELTRQVKNELTQHTNTAWNNKLQKLSHTDNTLWKTTQMLKHSGKQIPALKDNGQVYLTDNEKAQAIATVFQKAQELDTERNEEEQNHIINETQFRISINQQIPKRKLSTYLTNAEELKKLVKTLRNGKLPRADEICYIFLINISKKAICQLTYIINAILRLQHYPTKWKNATVVLTAKPGKDPNVCIEL